MLLIECDIPTHIGELSSLCEDRVTAQGWSILQWTAGLGAWNTWELWSTDQGPHSHKHQAQSHSKGLFWLGWICSSGSGGSLCPDMLRGIVKPLPPGGLEQLKSKSAPQPFPEEHLTLCLEPLCCHISPSLLVSPNKNTSMVWGESHTGAKCGYEISPSQLWK